MSKTMYVLVLLSISVVSYTMDKNKPKDTYSPSPTMQAHNKHYFAVELPKAAFGKNEKDTVGSNLQHGGQYNALPSQNRRFGRGSSGKEFNDKDSKL
jgi:hypothetical protein